MLLLNIYYFSIGFRVTEGYVKFDINDDFISHFEHIGKRHKKYREGSGLTRVTAGYVVLDVEVVQYP